MNAFFSKNFSFILLAACGVGFLVPKLQNHLSEFIMGFLFIVLFASYFQMDINFSEVKKNTTPAILFTIIRFLALPFMLYFSIKPFSEFYAFAFFFLAFIPSGVTSPAITNILKGNFGLGLFIVLFSCILVVFTIPFFTPHFYDTTEKISSWPMLRTLLFTVILPFFLHLPFRKINKFRSWVKTNLPTISISFIAGILVLVVASIKAEIIDNYQTVLKQLGISFIFFISLYLFGFYLFFKKQHADRVAFSVSSGLNNLGLGILLSVLYLSPAYTIFFITSEIAWVSVMTPAKYILKKRKNDTE